MGVGPGSIIERTNEVWIANDFIYVSVEMTCVLDAANELKRYESKLEEVKRTLWAIRKRKFEFPKVKDLIEEVEVTINRVTEKLRVTSLWFVDQYEKNQKSDSDIKATKNSVGTRKKRAAAAIVAGVAVVAAIAGVAITALVKVTNVEKQVRAMGREITTIKQNLDELGEAVNKAINSMNEVEEKLENISEDFDMIVSLVYIQSHLANIEEGIEFIYECIHFQADAIIRAKGGQITPKSLPYGKLVQILAKAALDWQINPIFDSLHLWDYYIVMKAFLSTSGIIIKIPMSSDFKFESYNIYPFPSYNGEEIVTLDGPAMKFIKSKRYHSCQPKKEVDCVDVRNVTICDETQFPLKYDAPPYDCCYSLVLNLTHKECKFVGNPPEAAIVVLQGIVGAFWAEKTLAMINCPNTPRRTFEAKGTMTFNSDCDLKSGQFFYPGRRIFREKETMKELLPNYKIRMADNISFLAIPDKFKFKRLDNVVLVDTPSMELTDIFTDEIRSIVIVVLFALIMVFAIMIAVVGTRLWKRRELLRLMVHYLGGNKKCEREDVEFLERTHLDEDEDTRQKYQIRHVFTHVAADN